MSCARLTGKGTSKVQVQGRGHWKQPGSLRNYEKADRMQKVAEKVGRSLLDYGEGVRVRLDDYFQARFRELLPEAGDGEGVNAPCFPELCI